MTRQHTKPYLMQHGVALNVTPLSFATGAGQINEIDLQSFVHENPDCLPIAEVDPIFINPVPLCRELRTNAGPIDNLMITASGLPIIIECKLWRNPEGRREVVGQILDYAKELTRWSSADLQREVAKYVERDGNPILALLREAGHEVDEVAFNDALTHNLRRGRFLLLIVGDGIREGVEAITEYLQVHAGLHFSLGLIEMPMFDTDNGMRLILPRVLARTQLITRTVVDIPEGQVVIDDVDQQIASHDALDPLSRINFWKAFVGGMHLDDPEQRLPNQTNNGFVTMPLPVDRNTVWFTIYRSEARWEVGVYLSYQRDTIGADVVSAVIEDWPEIEAELGGTVELSTDKDGRMLIQDSYRTGPWAIGNNKEKALEWLRRRSNDFVNVLRPRVKSAAADIKGE